ncbi:hypothetical protein CPB83DRAFT_337411 [Crepidotus variabilis]|uniref:Uncharacterized protein n=1 Tax=Crepidotus variabilis TaxID=179855 RepID=A0A9P6JVF8_9AGAR|nr:hypothetical protein CPB83DRAFT_337411 [Crepidotus variabilis]
MASPPAPKEDNLSDIYADPVPPIDADGAPDSEDSFGDRYADPVLPLNADTEAAKGDEFIELVATTFTSDEEVQQPKSPSASEVMCIDVDKDDSPSSTGAVVAQAGLSKDNRNNDSASTAKLRTVEPASFYKPAERTHVRKGKEKAQDLSTAPAPMDVDSKEDDDEVMVVSDTPQ